jgi:F-type H+-transporting ATPase subunit b
MAVPLVDVQVQQAADSPLLSPSPGLMIWTLVMFGITLFILKRYVFGPVGAMLEKRRAEIAQSIEDAERSRDEANALLDDYKTQLAEARKEADQLRELGRKEGERQGAQLVSAAQQQRDRVLADAEQQVVAQTRQAASGLRDDVVQLALSAAEKVSGRALTEADHRRLIEEAIDQADLSALRQA